MDIGILSLQGDVAEHRAALTEVGARPRPVRRPGDLVGLDGIVLPGGESTTMSMLLDSSGLAGPLGSALDAGMPAFGTCAGMILLAASIADGRPGQRCYGAIDLSVRRNGIGRQLESFECDLAVAAVPGGPVHAVFIRAPVVESAGPGVEVLGRWRSSAVLCRQGAILVSAFHPELTADRRIHRLFVSMVEHRAGGAGGALVTKSSGPRPVADGVVAGTSEGQGR
ncbi:MAG: pyridoxal 5'-phosphate synthase glutaminase subunit PdxT [Acidimicrobiales bacterium]